MKALIYTPQDPDTSCIVNYLKDVSIEPVVITTPTGIKKELKMGNFDILLIDKRNLAIIAPHKKIAQETPVILIADKNSIVDFAKLIPYQISGLITRPYKIATIKKALSRAVKSRREVLANKKMITSLKQKVQELGTLNEIVQAINSSLEPKDILHTIMAKTASLIKAEGWSILLCDHDKQELVFEAAAGEAGGKLIGLRLKVGQGVAGWVAKTGKSLIVADVTKDPRFYSGVDKKTKFTTKSILCVPMKSRDKIIGVVEVVNKIGGEPFSNADLEIFENFVAHITIALQNANMYQRVEEASLTDDLTKLYNNRYCNQFLNDFLSVAKGTRRKISLIFLDIDYFKLVDDNYGHLVGSETLRHVGNRIKMVIRPGDVPVRYGGDEYIVILPDTDKEIAATVAERIRIAIYHKPFVTFDKRRFKLSVTLGVATFPTDAKDRDDLIGKADKAMYRGKATGRNRVVLA